MRRCSVEVHDFSRTANGAASKCRDRIVFPHAHRNSHQSCLSIQSAAKFFTGFDALNALSLDTPSQKHVACCAASVRYGYSLLCLLVSCRQHTVGTFDVTFVDRPPSICILKGRDNENRHLAHAFRIHPRAHVRLRMFVSMSNRKLVLRTQSVSSKQTTDRPLFLVLTISQRMAFFGCQCNHMTI